ncbi:MAG: lipase maturation factor family protein [Elusimicrobia bacterium]|nr:lipase maturation factor family protein [Elusimicrobiota bacterium]
MGKRPVLVFDGDCGFCRVWIERWRAATGDLVEYVPFQSAAGRFPKIPPEAFSEAVCLVEPNGRVSRGALAAFRALALAPNRRDKAWLFLYESLPPFARASEAVYRAVAKRRPFFSRLTRLLWGPSPVPPPIDGTRRAVLIGLGLCYLIAFVSLGVQVRGLIGSRGILPAPGLSDAALVGLCAAGALAALGLTAGTAAGPCALACWALYLLLEAAGSVFLNFQWDALLLEAGLIVVFLSPWSLRPSRASSPSRGALFLLRLLLVKLMLQSGLVKLLSGDPSWRSLDALLYHYWTQPLPAPAAWWADRLPLAAQRASCAVLFAVELGSPLLLLGPRRVRLVGAAVVAGLMALIALTGNYGIFNLLTAVLCLAALDDGIPSLARLAPGTSPSAPVRRGLIVGAFAALWLTVSAAGFLAGTLGLRLPAAASRLFWAAAPLRSVNNYGLFAAMTTRRDEIAVEVSADGKDWREWPFRWKPGDPRRALPFVAPHMPRLDWQMWFAALGPPEASPWLGNLLYRILQGSEPVKALLGPDPLSGRRPLYVRATLYSYSFASPEQRRADGSWWHRERLGPYFPAVSLSLR